MILCQPICREIIHFAPYWRKHGCVRHFLSFLPVARDSGLVNPYPRFVQPPGILTSKLQLSHISHVLINTEQDIKSAKFETALSEYSFACKRPFPRRFLF